ncbi:efflux transporter outer membrane subunit [Sphingomonas crocodyli]|uniref:TolC family protein n=1 Tax=Sphingomonas crocodyli TaxID=1979270 RepID=A0A437MB85_9SPHN|nr:TolC family protein [Sphingomonas crocodyli]RVT94914.1 TolC family protein [Sphingomonas crocodyli]
MRLIHTLLAATALIGTTAQAVGPDYKAPIVSPGAEAPFLGATSSTTVTANPAAEQWWRLYDDPILDRLIADALAANTDVRVAVARIEKARAALRGAANGRLPQTGIDASANYGQVSAIQTIPGVDRESWRIDAGLSVSYEVDLFGRVGRGVEAAKGDLAAAAFDADAVRVAVAADTARAYLDAASAAERIAVAERIVKLLDDSTRITNGRFEAGRATRLDVIRVQALRDQRKADIPALLAERENALFRLATLTGRAPRDLPSDAGTRTTIPRLTSPVPVGDGHDLLARRPDVRAAERRLAADTARIGVATADLYPRISLGGGIGQTSTGLGNLFGGGPLNWFLGPLISWAFPNQEPVRARIAASKADAKASLASFDGTVLTALRETETALSAYQRELQRRDALQAARDESAAAARISAARQREGQIDYLSSLDAQRTFADSEAALAASDARIATAQIALFRALGGGWQQAPAVVDTKVASK